MYSVSVASEDQQTELSTMSVLDLLSSMGCNVPANFVGLLRFGIPGYDYGEVVEFWTIDQKKTKAYSSFACW